MSSRTATGVRALLADATHPLGVPGPAGAGLRQFSFTFLRFSAVSGSVLGS